MFGTRMERDFAEAADFIEESLNSNVNVQTDLINELKKLDLSTNEAKILLFLMSHGSSTASDISRNTGIQRTETYHYISMLLTKGVVLSTFTKPQKYYSLPFDQVVDCLIQTKYNVLRGISDNKAEYQEKLNRIIKSETTFGINEKEGYQIIVGEDTIYSKIKKILSDVKEEVIMYASEKTLANFYHSEVTDDVVASAEREVVINIRTPCKTTQEYLGKRSDKIPITIKSVSESVPVSFMIFDNKEMILIVDSIATKKQGLYGFYTNNIALVMTFRMLYDKIN